MLAWSDAVSKNMWSWLQREYVNFHNSKRFKELGELYKSTEMSGFVNTTHQAVHFLCSPLWFANGLLEHDRQGFVLWEASWPGTTDKRILLLTNPK